MFLEFDSFQNFSLADDRVLTRNTTTGQVKATAYFTAPAVTVTNSTSSSELKIPFTLILFIPAGENLCFCHPLEGFFEWSAISSHSLASFRITNN